MRGGRARVERNARAGAHLQVRQLERARALVVRQLLMQEALEHLCVLGHGGQEAVRALRVQQLRAEHVHLLVDRHAEALGAQLEGDLHHAPRVRLDPPRLEEEVPGRWRRTPRQRDLELLPEHVHERRGRPGCGRIDHQLRCRPIRQPARPFLRCDRLVGAAICRGRRVRLRRLGWRARLCRVVGFRAGVLLGQLLCVLSIRARSVLHQGRLARGALCLGGVDCLTLHLSFEVRHFS